MHGVLSNNRNFRIQVQGYAMLIFLPQLRANVSLFESVNCFVPGKLWNFPECYVINVLKINCGLISKEACVVRCIV